MMTKEPPSFDIVNTSGTKGFRFEYGKILVPRVGDHVVVYSDSESAKTAMEGEVTQVLWIIGNDSLPYKYERNQS